MAAAFRCFFPLVSLMFTSDQSKSTSLQVMPFPGRFFPRFECFGKGKQVQVESGESTHRANNYMTLANEAESSDNRTEMCSNEDNTTDSNDDWTESESSDSLTELNNLRSDDDLNKILEDYFPLINDKYDITVMVKMLNNAIIWKLVIRRDQAEIFNDFLDKLPTFNEYVINDMEEWAIDNMHNVQLYVECEDSGKIDADWKLCEHVMDLINFIEKLVVPRLRPQAQRHIERFSDLRNRVLDLKHSKVSNGDIPLR